MLTICAIKSEPDAMIIESITRENEPAGTIKIIRNQKEAINTIIDTDPDIVWLDASKESFAAASKKRVTAPDVNFIFVSEDPGMAFYAMKVRASGFVLGPLTEEAVRDELQNLRYTERKITKLLQVCCFGNFEVFKDGNIVRFSRSLSKEVFAYLIDRRGAGCTVQEICSVIWEHRPVDTNLKSQCRVILSSLRKDLEQAGAGQVLVKSRNYWGVDTERISCDYYEYLSGRDQRNNQYNGEYMSQYSWVENTSGRLYQIAVNRE